jgi:radical SAM protein with 4Fe4S-binding SPASM domain
VSDIINLGVKRVTLSGGEILLSDYWYETAKSLSQAGVEVSLITNGTMIDHDCAEKIKRAGVVSVSVSIDDFKDSKDTIRGIGSYENAVAGVKYLKAENIPVSIITTVNALNLSRLDEMRSDFTAIGADSWCLKPIYPVGEASRNKELWLDECDINKVMEFCYSAMFVQGIPVVPAMAFEAHSKKGAAVQQFLYGDAVHTEVHGPYAGIFSAQLHPNGNLVGDCMCLSDYAAGNVKERSLSEIWRDKSSFRVLREFDSSMLSGYCGMCDRRTTCKGGDLNARLASGGIYAENKFCTYRNFKLYGITI